MLRAKRLPQILSQGLCEGIHAALLLTSDGALLASAASRSDGNRVDLIMAAITANIWNNMEGAAASSKVGQLSSMLMTLTEGRVAVKSTGKGYLIAVYADRDTNVGLLLARTEALSSYFTRVFEQLNDQT